MNFPESHDLSIFRKSIVDDISAAIVGINSADWVSIQEDQASEERAAMLMKKNRFDVLPISSNASVTEFFHTITWNNYSNISRSTIKETDIVPATIRISDVIRKFNTYSRLY